MLLKEIDNKEESWLHYNDFMNLYIKLYYEPLVEEYDEMKYFTQDYDKKMMGLILHKVKDKDTKIDSIYFKNT